MGDDEVYLARPDLRQIFNKLWLSESLGYLCGPGGVPPPTSGWYVSRPMMNLRGMGLGAEKLWIGQGDYKQVPPGHFWTEWFDGPHYSISYSVKNGQVSPTSCYQGFNEDTDLSSFQMWKRVPEIPDLMVPDFLLQHLITVDNFNVEFIGDKVIEAHPRESPDPQCNQFVPVWHNEENVVEPLTKEGYTYISAPDDADGFLPKPRLGFLVK